MARPQKKSDLDEEKNADKKKAKTEPKEEKEAPGANKDAAEDDKDKPDEQRKPGDAPATAPKVGSLEPNLIKELYTGTVERTVQESAYHSDSLSKPFNPDDLYQKTGDYSLYEDMMKDDQVNVCMNLKKDLVLASGWDIMCEDSDEQSDVIKKDLEIALSEDPDVAFDDSLDEIQSAFEFGFSLTEKIFKNRPDGSLTLKTLKTRHPATWLIYTDEKGNIEKYEQRGTKTSMSIKPKSLIHYVNNRKFQNPYGTSDLRAAYNAWFVKRQIIKYYGIYLEKAASPTPVASYHKDAPSEAVTAIYNAIKQLQTKTALAIPKDIELEFLESKSNGEAYVKGINIFNMFIGRALVIPDLLGFQGSETSGGSFSLGKDQMMVLFKHIARRRAIIERIVNHEIIKPIVFYNHGIVEKFPKFRLRPIRDEDAIELAKLWIEVTKGKLYKPNEEEINHLRKLTKFPEGDVEFMDPAPQFGAPNDPNSPNPNDPNAKPGENPNDPNAKDSKNPKEVSPKEDVKDDDKEKAPPTAKQFTKVYSKTSGDYEKKVDFKAIESHLERFKNKVIIESEPVVKGIFEDLYDQIEKKKIISNQKPERMEEIKLKRLKDLKLILKRNLREAFADSKAMAGREIFKANFKTPLPDDKFLEVLEAETFQYVNDWEYQVTKKARTAMFEAIRDGKPLSAVIDMLNEIGMKDSMGSLERFARTKFTDVTNRGRLEFFNESGVVAAYQYSAILDGRTSEICDGLHNKIFKAGTEPVPPMHFNCRSILIPITKFEEFEVDDKAGGKPIDTFIDENKGEGFSKYSLGDQSQSFHITRAFNEPQHGTELHAAPGPGLCLHIKEFIISFSAGCGVKFVENTMGNTRTIIERIDGDRNTITHQFKEPLPLSENVNLGLVTIGSGYHSITIVGCIAPPDYFKGGKS